jgi:hypothetical protein
MISLFGSKVKHEHKGKPHEVKHGGKRAYDFEYSCVKNGKKYTVEGVISTDNLDHAKKRTGEIYKGLRDKIADGHVTPKKLEKIVKKALHHESDLKSIEIHIKKKH